jgi:hypothetical protein
MLRMSSWRVVRVAIEAEEILATQLGEFFGWKLVNIHQKLGRHRPSLGTNGTNKFSTRTFRTLVEDKRDIKVLVS